MPKYNANNRGNRKPERANDDAQVDRLFKLFNEKAKEISRIEAPDADTRKTMKDDAKTLFMNQFKVRDENKEGARKYLDQLVISYDTAYSVAGMLRDGDRKSVASFLEGLQGNDENLEKTRQFTEVLAEVLMDEGRPDLLMEFLR